MTSKIDYEAQSPGPLASLHLVMFTGLLCVQTGLGKLWPAGRMRPAGTCRMCGLRCALSPRFKHFCIAISMTNALAPTSTRFCGRRISRKKR